jgi:nucleoside-diphosphate-sugar epimerase
MARIFVTGATGFVGRHLVPALLGDGHRVRVLVRSAEKAQSLRGLGCEVVQTSSGLFAVPPAAARCTSSEACPDEVWGEVWIHLAAVHRGPRDLIYRTNVEGTAQLLRAAQGARKILYLSTVTATENPAWPYAHSVWLAEQAIRQSSLNYTILRCSVIIGPGDPFLGGLVALAQRWPVMPIIGSGKTRFQPISVHDVVRCICRAISDPKYDNRTLALGGPEILSYEEIVDAVLEALGISKRKVHLPRRAMRTVVRWLERMGVQTPFAPAHFLSHDHLGQSPTVIEDEFGFRPQTLREVLAPLQGSLYCRGG